jgi:signal transduction histidine kinase/DNA-binding response OmpR family regulator/Tfp pilus assembly protein PilF
MKKLSITVYIFFALVLSIQSQSLDSLWTVYTDQNEKSNERGYAGIGIVQNLMASNPDSANNILSDVILLAKQNADTLILGHAYKFRGYLYYIRSEYETAIENWEKSKVFYAQLNDKRGTVAIDVNIGLIYLQQGDYDKALDTYSKAMDDSKDVKDSITTGTIIMNMGSIYMRKGDYAKAKELIEQSLEYFIPINEKISISRSYNNLGIIASEQGNHIEALANYKKSLKIGQELQDGYEIAMANLNIGLVFLDQKNYQTAEKYMYESLAYFEGQSNEFNIAKINNNLGVINLDQKKYSVALEYFEKANKLREKIKDQRGLALTLVNMGMAYTGLEKYQLAEQYYLKGIQIHETIGHASGLVMAYSHLAQSYNEQGKYNQAILQLNKALPLSQEHNLSEEEMYIARHLSNAYEGLRNFEKAFEQQSRYIFLKDSLDKINNREELLNQQVQFELDKQSFADSLNFASRELQTQLEYESNINRLGKTFTVILVVFLLIAFFVFYRFNLRRKLAKAETLRLKELDDFKNKLYTNITHEFRTPLTVIMGVNDQIEGYEEERRLIRRNSSNLLRLINQILDLSKLESGKAKLNLIQADIIIYLKYLIESFHSLAYSKKINLTFYPDVDELMMDFDREKLEIVISNLLSNAIKFTPEFGKVLVVAKQISHNGNSQLELRVIDSGVGIKEEDLEKVFDRYYQTDNKFSTDEQGTGIGLALTKELIELQNGSVKVKSTVGEGAEFLVHIPVTNNASQQDIESHVIPELRIPETEVKESLKKTDQPVLLIIEDNADVMRYLKGTLDSDYQLLFARNGQQGIDVALEQVPEIIISDVMMPEKDGFEVCDFLKNDERTSHIPIILLTAKADYESRIQGLKRGADAYLAKPFQKDELLVRLEKLLELRVTMQKRFATYTLVSDKVEEEPELVIENAFIQKLRQIVETNMEDPEFGINELCNSVNLSRMQVHRKLKALTGITTTQFIRDIRLEKSLEFLKNPDMNISEVAYQVGFSDPNYYSRSFVQKYGKAPSEYLKR